MNAADLYRAEPPPLPLAVGEREAARLLSVSVRTLYNWRRDGIGPSYRRVGARLLYPVNALRDWLNTDSANQPARREGK